MCTSISLPCPDGRRLFGRTLDWVEHFGEKLLPVPRGFRFDYGRRCGDSTLPADSLYAMIGMGNDAGGYPLYADALNERGLCMAGLRFAQGAHYQPIDTPLPADAVRLAPWELIPYILGRCATVTEAAEALRQVQIMDVPFPLPGGGTIPTSPLHWHISTTAAPDGVSASLIVEQTAEGLHLYTDDFADSEATPAGRLSGVLTNDPAYPDQISACRAALSDESAALPGGYSSTARFGRAASLRNRLSEVMPTLPSNAPTARFLHLLAAVAPPPGAGTPLPDSGLRPHTLYASCMDGSTGTYYCLTEEGTLISGRVPTP